MTSIYTDTETYELYDGTTESEESISKDILTPEQLSYFKTNKKKGYYYPVLNSRKYSLGCALIDGNKKPIYFKSAKEHWDYLIKCVAQNRREGHNTFIFSHNAKYDLYSYGAGNFEQVDLIKIKRASPLFAILTPEFETELKCRRCKKEWNYIGKETETSCPYCKLKKRLPCGFVIDSYSFFPMSLEKIGEMVELPKGIISKEIKEVDELKGYVLRDCEILKKGIDFISDTIEEFSHRPKKLMTMPQVAMSTWRHWLNLNYYKDKPYSSYLLRAGRLPRTIDPMFLLMAMKGGRCECFHSGIHDNITMIDIRSQYPSVLVNEFEMPDPTTERKIMNPDKEYDRETLFSFIGVAEATIKCPDHDLGYLRHDTEKHKIYPKNITMRDWWTLYELKRAEEEGYEIKEIHEALIYKPLPFNPFKEFMLKLYEQRKKSSKQKGYVIKLLMNSLTGKFAEKRREKIYQRIHRKELKDYADQGYEFEIDLGEEYIISKRLKDKIPNHAHPIITILIYAYARDLLYRNMKKIPYEDLIYCDTDSIVLKNWNKHKDKFDMGEGLGQFDIVEGSNGEKIINQTGEFIMKKIYQIYDKEGNVIKSALAGNPNKEMTKGQLWGMEKVNIRMTYGIGKAMQTGNFNKIGTFFTEEKLIRPNKEIKLPMYSRRYMDRDKIVVSE